MIGQQHTKQIFNFLFLYSWSDLHSIVLFDVALNYKYYYYGYLRVHE